MMKERVAFQDFNRLWAEHVNKSTSLRMTDDQTERDFWKKFMAKKTGYVPEASSRQVIDKLLPIFREFGVETALEFGPGWGNYTIDLAKFCREVECVDISQDVLDFILRIGKEQGLSNISTVQSKWETFSAERKYDLVFGYNCFYRQPDLADCFARMDRAANKLCVAGMNTGLAPAWVHELADAGADIKWEWKDYIYFVDVLYQMGIDPNVIILPFEKKLSYPDKESLVRGECARCGATNADESAAAEILCRHFTQQEDGSWQASLFFRSGVVWWQK